MTVRTSELSPAISAKSLIIITGLLIASVFVSFLIGRNGPVVGIVIISLLIGIPLLVKTVVDIHFGFFLLLFYSYFLFLIGRLLLPVRVPTGVGVEIIEVALLLGIFVSDIKNKNKDWSYFKNPVTYVFLISEFYYLLQFFNPNSVSIGAWLMASRGIFFEIISYFIVVKIFTSLKLVKTFTKLWLAFALLAALYSFYQEIFGYQDFEWLDINSTPGGIYLIQNWGILRKFSFMSDVANFGITMSFTGVFCFVLALGPFSTEKKIVLFVSAILMFIAMSFSGTRTATVIIPAGLFMYILMSLDKKSSLVILTIGIIGFAAIMYGPFYGGVISRVRTAFQPTGDASMNVREYNRKRIQPYIHTHPIGGGLFTTDSEGETFSPGHPLAGFATDSGFLKTALTTGWIGLLILMSLYFSVMSIGITNYFRAKDPVIKSLYVAFISLFFSLLVANYAQSAMGQKPVGLMVFSIFAIMPNLIKFDKD